MNCNYFENSYSRRDLLRKSGCGFAQLAFAGVAGAAGIERLAAGEEGNRLAFGSGQTHFPAKAKRIIFLFMWGGPSHVDLFDPKPKLNQRDGKDLVGSDVGVKRKSLGKLIGSPFRFKKHGESGIEISELFPRLAHHADKLCVVRSMHTEGSAHGEALLRLHTGAANLVRPSIGAWLSYGLGRANQNLPAFVTISPPRGHGGVQNYGNAFLPDIHQGTAIGSAEIPIAKAEIANLVNKQLSRTVQQRQLRLIQELNQKHLDRIQSDRRVEGLIESYELAFKMQTEVPQIMSLQGESQKTLDEYGVNQKPTDNFARQCLMARKFAEQGVRYIQVSTDYTWDHHNKVVEGHKTEASKVDRPVAALLEDLNRRGLLDETLVLWGAEFGRTPTVENGDGRGHHPQGFTVWMAGGGLKPGVTYGASDEFGYRPVENPVHMHDLHATLLHQMGLDHERLTYRHEGRDFRLTDVYGHVVDGIIA